MKVMLRTLPAALLLLLTGCTVGPSIHRLHALSTGQGIQVALIQTTRPSTQHGFEVLSAEDDGLYVRLIGAQASEALYWIPYSEIVSAEFDAMPQLNFSGQKAPTLRRMHDLRLLTRFPQGVDDKLRKTLLRVYGQEEIATFK